MRLVMVLAAGMLYAFLAGAGGSALNGEPYASIIARNVFGLHSIPEKVPVGSIAMTPLPQITVNGIAVISGEKEALYKVMIPNPSPIVCYKFYVVGEGKSVDNIKVVKVDTDANVVSFDNHGTIQELQLSAAPKLPTPAMEGLPTPAMAGLLTPAMAA